MNISGKRVSGQHFNYDTCIIFNTAYNAVLSVDFIKYEHNESVHILGSTIGMLFSIAF